MPDTVTEPTGYLLALDNCEEDLAMALAGPDGEFLAGQTWRVPGRTVEFLAPTLDKALAALGIAPKDVARIACARGPGSFTGIRLALSFAAGLAAASGALLAGLDHAALAAANLSGLVSTPVWVLTHARKNQVYARRFQAPDGPGEPHRVMTLDQAIQAVADDPGPLAATGSGLSRNPGLARTLSERADITLIPEHLHAPTPRTLVRAAMEAGYSTGPVEPLYLRPSDAEANRAAIARARGVRE